MKVVHDFIWGLFLGYFWVFFIRREKYMEEKYIKILSDIVKINTENGNEKELALYLKKLLEDNGISSKLIEFSDDRASLVAEISNGNGPVLALAGHMDVVSAGDENEWKYPPFDAHIEDNVMWGRGTSDMKAGLAALVIAFIEMKKSKNFKGKLRLIATVGEEVGQYGAGQITDQGYLDDVDSVIIAEPCSVAIAFAHKGSLNYKVRSKGVEAHSSTPELGSNAIEHLLEAMVEIKNTIEEKSKEVHNEILGQTFHNITLVKGGSQVNSLPSYAEFEANARTIPEFDNKRVIEEVEKVLEKLNEEKGYDLKVEVTADLPAVETNPESRLVQTVSELANQHPKLKPKYLFEQMNEILGGKMDLDKIEGFEDNMVKPIVISGTTDCAQFIKGNKDINLAVYGPGIPMLGHKIDERIDLEQYLEFIEVYKEIIEAYLG